ncbi:hypothetical protein PAXRUDRAFT_17906 [Paxillus rubicundulus Ve08.2h10]|uniref:DUF659 domain-containing protein n=1 Tax=Paxillus rubicundulus Ve08.2h10 TaxID=930991 RepID=A0A0D0CNJ1_9AGAM|nr:hypothetical protein PAXRUDRAFT_17906 [Paxillus rubicundulus Ve08.2h10]
MAEELLKQMLLAISSIEMEWGATVIACTIDASGESAKARCLLQRKFLHLVVPDCLAHQWNLIVGDLFKVKDNYGDKTQVLALLHDIQIATIGKTLTIIQAILTQWLSHYLAYRHLLEVRPALELLVTKHENALLTSGKWPACEKAATAIMTIKDAMFWHAIARWKNLLEPIALMTNIHQAAHAQLEYVVISFGFLYFQYSKLNDNVDSAA